MNFKDFLTFVKYRRPSYLVTSTIIKNYKYTDIDQAGLLVPAPAKQPTSNKVLDINLSTCDFREMLESVSFVDKTLLIKTVLSSKDNISVTAPQRFGKSTNANMLKEFLRIEVDKNGNRITKSKENEPVCDTDNYKLFTRNIPKLPELKLKIANEENIMNEHLGKYPVIYVNFKCGEISSFKQVTINCKRIVHDAYTEHYYLCKSEKLNKSEKEVCQKWCSKTKYKSFEDNDVERSLQYLSKYLFKHFNHQCFVVVDEYDAICSESIFSVDQNAIKKIIKFYTSILLFLLKDNEKNVRSGFITGIFHIYATGLTGLNNLIKYRFLQNDEFYNFYGLTMSEVIDLKKRFSVNEDDFNEVKNYYNGYQRGENKIFSTWSVMSYLRNRTIENYWVKSGILMNLTASLKILKVQYQVGMLLNDDKNTIKIKLFKNIGVSDITDLKKMLEDPDIELMDPSLFFYFLLEQGYFSICEIDPKQNTADVKIPNEEIRLEFKEKLAKYYADTYKLDFRKVLECARYWNLIHFDNEKNIKDNLSRICDILHDIFKHMTFKSMNKPTMHHIIYVILHQTNYSCESEKGVLYRKIVDLVLERDDTFIIIELKHKKTCEIGLQQIIDNKYFDFFKPFGNPRKHFILLGINMNNKRDISMCGLIDNIDIKNKIIF